MAAHFACVDVSSMQVSHITLDAPLAPALRAPYVSYVHIKSAAPGHTRAELERETANVAKADGIAGCTGGGWAKMYERDEYVLLHGWEDPKVRVCVMWGMAGLMHGAVSCRGGEAGVGAGAGQEVA